MGKVLQIRVKAESWAEDVEKAWPRLVGLAWPEQYVSQILPPPNLPRGVLDLVQSLDDQRRFGTWSSEVVNGLSPGIAEAVKIKDKLEKALADWNPTQANVQSDALEEELLGLEQEAKRLDAPRDVKKKKK